MHKIWLLKLILPWPYGRLLTGFLLLCVLLPVFYLGHSDDIGSTTPALFYSLIIAYIIPIFSYIAAKPQEALLELRPLLDLEDSAFEKLRAHLDSTSLRMIALQLGAGDGLSIQDTEILNLRAITPAELLVLDMDR
jgi:hypothetical protein